MSKITDHLDRLERAINELLGTRITREQVRERLAVCDKTLHNMLKQGRFPRPVEGKWRLADVVEWERSKALRN